MFSLRCVLFGHISPKETLPCSLTVCFFSPILSLSLPLLPFFSAVNNRAIHVATLWNTAWGELVGGGPEVTLRKGGRKTRLEEEGRRSFPLFSSPQLFYEGRNIIFSTQASPRHNPRAELRTLKCQPRWPPPWPLTPLAFYSTTPPPPSLLFVTLYNNLSFFYICH